MGLKATRSNLDVGPYSKAMIIPAALETGPKSNIAANRLVLADVRGVISCEDLLEFLEKFVEPNFWSWYAEKINRLNQNKRKDRPQASEARSAQNHATSGQAQGGSKQ